MQKLRSSYAKYQQQTFASKPRFATSQRVDKLIKTADFEIQNMQNNNQFTEIQQTLFYKEKFTDLRNIAVKYEKKTISDQVYYRSAQQVLQKDFKGQPYRGSNKRGPIVQALGMTSNVSPVYNPKQKSPLKSFFQQQQQKRSKSPSFSSLLNPTQTPLHMGLRSVTRSKLPQPQPQNNYQLKRLEQQNRRLKQKLEEDKIRQRGDEDDQRLGELRRQLNQLDEENRRLRTEVNKSQRSQYYADEDVQPYSLKIRDNDIVKINNKNLNYSQRSSHYGGSQIHFDKEYDYVRSQYSHSPIKKSQSNMLSQQLLNSSQSSIQTQYFNLQNSQLHDPLKNQMCLQKLAFFKRSMVISKGYDFDIAIKRSQFNLSMDRLRLILYVNNKENKDMDVNVDYQVDFAVYELKVNRKMTRVKARGQARQQIQITMKNAKDFGYLIGASVKVGTKTKLITLPALFIDFNYDYKYQFDNISFLQRNLSTPLTIKPMSQFSTFDRAMTVLQMHRQYDDHYQIGKLYGKSKACKAVVKLTWKKDGRLVIQTCEEWRILMGHLFLNADET